MEILVLVNKKKKLQNKDFTQGEESKYDGVTVDKDVIEKAIAAGIDPNPILSDIVNAVRNANSSNPYGICIDSDVELIKRALIEKVQQILSKFGINEIEVGSYLDPYVMDGYTEVRLMLSSSGHLYEWHHDSRSNHIELSSYSLEQFHDPKRILHNLFEKLIQVTEKNRANIKEIEELANDFSLNTVT